MSNFDAIRPFEDVEIPTAVKRLNVSDSEVQQMQKQFPLVDFKQLFQVIPTIETKADFQQHLVAPFLQNLENTTTKGVEIFGIDQLNSESAYLFLSNHRDIVLDSAFFNVKLHEAGLDTTQIAIGDNLLSNPVLKTIYKINKAFTVQRGLKGRAALEALVELSKYITHTLQNKGESIWLAHREGRAKNGDDVTQPGLIKMLGLSRGNQTALDHYKSFNIVPLSISYQYNPCDVLMANELYQKDTNKEYKKAEGEDLNSILTGITGQKGKVVINIGELVRNYSSPAELIKQIDCQIHQNYHLHDTNLGAYDLLHGHHSEASKAFEKYMTERLSSIQEGAKLIPHFLQQYANPVINAKAN